MILAWLVVAVPLSVVAYFACRKRRLIRDSADMSQLGE
jgi:hypothetical protein